MNRVYLVYASIIGGILGGFILSPLVMVVFDHIHAVPGFPDFVGHDHSVWNSIIEVFTPAYYKWTIIHGVIGICLGLICTQTMRIVFVIHTRETEAQQKRRKSLAQFEDDVEGLSQEIARLKQEVNALLIANKEPKKYW